MLTLSWQFYYFINVTHCYILLIGVYAIERLLYVYKYTYII